jgi:hypothetical protein
MQDIIEEAIRWLGYASLRLATLGAYRGGTLDDRLPEGAVGLGVVAGLMYLAYALWP